MKATGPPSLRLVVGVLLAGNAGGAGAQTPASEAEDPRSLEQVIVTAQQRAENLQDVPLAVTAATGDAPEASQFTKLNDVQFLAPTVQYTGGSAPS